MSKLRKVYSSLCLTALLLLSSCSTQSPPKETIDSDYSMFLPMKAISLNFYTDLNQNPMSSYLEERTSLTIDYTSSTPGEENTTFMMTSSTGNISDLIRHDLMNQYAGGLDSAIDHGMIHDYTTLVQEHAPNFMARIESYEHYRQIAYSDQGILSCFGTTLVEEELRGLPFTGPMINKTYLDQAGLDVPETIADWENVLETFHQMEITPFSFGADQGFHVLFDTFASAYGVTIGDLFFQENGVVKCSPLEDGYYDLLVLLNQWYEKEWISQNFSSISQEETVKSEFEQGKVGASVLSVNTLRTAEAISAQTTGTAMEFVPAPYPVLNQGDSINTRDYTKDFYNPPIFINAKVENPEELIQWIDFFYSEEGATLTNWGIVNETYTVNSQGQKEFTDLVLNNPDHPATTVLAQQTLQEMSLVMDWERESQFFYEGIHDSAWEQWGKASYHNVLPDTINYTVEELHYLNALLYSIENYVYQCTIAFITGTDSLDYYDQFKETLESQEIYKVIEIQQSALDRYLAR